MTRKELDRPSSSDWSAAEARARRALAIDPADPDALLLLANAFRGQQRFEEAKTILQPLVTAHPHMVEALVGLGTVLESLGEEKESVDVLSRAVDLAPLDTNAWFALSSSLATLEPPSPDEEDAISDARIGAEEIAVAGGGVTTLAALVQHCVGSSEVDIASIRRSTEMLFRNRRQADAEAAMARCVELVPDSRSLRFHYIVVLCGNGEVTKALDQLEQLIQREPRSTVYRLLRALSLGRLRQYSRSIEAYEALLDDCSQLPGTWLAYAHALRAAGRHRDASVAAQKAVALMPSYAEAYSFLAGVNSFRFSQSELDNLRFQAGRPHMPLHSRAQLHFALGKALEEIQEFRESFEHYRRSNTILRARTTYDPQARTRFVQRSKSLFTAALFASRTGSGSDAQDPIFVVGMPRSGSTLIEQILSSHSAVEGLGELSFLDSIAAQAGGGTQSAGMTRIYPEVLPAIGRDELSALGRRYLDLVRQRRKLGRPFFVDKMPGNFSHIGLLQLILPNARIIDARRHPLDCGLSCYKSYFPWGQPFTHDLREVGQYYADYVEVMAHYDDVLPGKVHRTLYEDLVADPEKEVRAILDYLHLPFEEACLRFYEQERAITTLSSEQVRLPIYSSAVGHWRNFDGMLGPLKQALGYVLEVYPAVPKFYPQLRATFR